MNLRHIAIILDSCVDCFGKLKLTAQGVDFFRNFYWDLGFYDIRYSHLEEK